MQRSCGRRTMGGSNCRCQQLVGLLPSPPHDLLCLLLSLLSPPQQAVLLQVKPGPDSKLNLELLKLDLHLGKGRLSPGVKLKAMVLCDAPQQSISSVWTGEGHPSLCKLQPEHVVIATLPEGHMVGQVQQLPNSHAKRPHVALLREPPAISQCLGSSPTHGNGHVPPIVVGPLPRQPKVGDLDTHRTRAWVKDTHHDVAESEVAVDQTCRTEARHAQTHLHHDLKLEGAQRAALLQGTSALVKYIVHRAQGRQLDHHALVALAVRRDPVERDQVGVPPQQSEDAGLSFAGAVPDAKDGYVPVLPVPAEHGLVLPRAHCCTPPLRIGRIAVQGSCLALLQARRPARVWTHVEPQLRKLDCAEDPV
mmetsp:Transcript_35658/g.89959  ORF Transcript_35658/g.89959 Transcript_35658/m.89959 type:complete len:364 (-) Transcript_35658:410-1501(-)